MQYILVAVPYVEEEFTSTWSILHFVWEADVQSKEEEQ